MFNELLKKTQTVMESPVEAPTKPKTPSVPAPTKTPKKSPLAPTPGVKPKPKAEAKNRDEELFIEARK